MLLMILLLSEALISLSSVDSLNVYVNRATHLLLFSNFLDIFSLMHCGSVDFRYGRDYAKRSLSSCPECLDCFTVFCYCFRDDLIVFSSSDFLT